jgi:hypothetical protein
MTCARAAHIVLVLLMAGAVQGQNDLGKSDDLARIALNPYVPEQIEGMPAIARDNLKNKLGQIATANGIGGAAKNQRFIITANIAVLTKDITPTAPPMQALTLEVTIYVGDGREGTKFASTSRTVKGVGENENKAYIAALKGINAKDPEFASVLETGKARIIEYYNSRCDLIIQQASSLAGQEKFDEALSELMSVPEVCKQCHEFAMEAAVSVFKSKAELDCQRNMMKARSFMAQDKHDEAADALSTGILPSLPCFPDALALMKQIEDHRCAAALGRAQGAWSARDVDGTAAALAKVSADSKCYQDALALTQEVRAWVKEKDGREWDFEMRKYQDNTDFRWQAQADNTAIRKMELNAARDIGVAYANRPVTNMVYNVNGWW